MKRPASIRFRLACGVGAVVACLCGASALAQAPASAGPAKTATGPGSISGLWFNPAFTTVRDRTGTPRPEPDPAPTGPPLMQPWAAALVQQRTKDVADGRPFAPLSASCLPYGMPSMMFPPGQLPIEILETPGQVTVLFEEYTTHRIIRLNQPHQKDPDETFFGDAVGHWEGDTLVVDTIAISDRTPIGLTARGMVQGYVPHTDALHTVERLRRTGTDTMEDRMTVDDPKTFTRPYTVVSYLKVVPGERMNEFFCESNRNPADATGHAGATLQGN